MTISNETISRVAGAVAHAIKSDLFNSTATGFAFGGMLAEMMSADGAVLVQVWKDYPTEPGWSVNLRLREPSIEDIEGLIALADEIAARTGLDVFGRATVAEFLTMTRARGVIHLNGLDPAALWNVCTSHVEPTWSEFEGLEIGGVRDEANEEEQATGETHMVGGYARDDAEFFTIYGRRKPGEDGLRLLEAITDCDTFPHAEIVASRLSRRSGLPVVISC